MPDNLENNQKLDRLEQITELLRSQSLLNKVGLAYRTLLLRRTRAGTDIEGRPFQPYSAGYASLRRRLGEPTHVVNLTMDHITGMLSKVTYSTSIGADWGSVEAWVSDPDKARIGKYHHEDGAGTSKVIRKWWGLSAEDKSSIEKTITTELDNLFKANL